MNNLLTGLLFDILYYGNTYSILSYGRIETLSGFANGIFLILISIFIVFEAIERLWGLFSLFNPFSIMTYFSLEPPDMNTSKLLLVSSLGLGVNLFGMFAMG